MGQARADGNSYYVELFSEEGGRKELRLWVEVELKNGQMRLADFVYYDAKKKGEAGDLLGYLIFLESPLHPKQSEENRRRRYEILPGIG